MIDLLVLLLIFGLMFSAFVLGFAVGVVSSDKGMKKYIEEHFKLFKHLVKRL